MTASHSRGRESERSTRVIIDRTISIGMLSAILQRGPVHFRHHDRSHIGDGSNLFVPSFFKISVVDNHLFTVATIIPTGIAVDGKTDILTLNAMLYITSILSLISQTWDKQNIVAVLAHDIDNGLEILSDFLVSSSRTITVIDMDRFVGQFKHHTTVVLEFWMLGNIPPYLNKILLIGITDRNVLGTNTWRTHNNIQSFSNHIFCHRHEHLIKILLEAVEVESMNITLTIRLFSWRVTPIGIHVQTDEIHFPAGIQNFVNQAFVV